MRATASKRRRLRCTMSRCGVEGRRAMIDETLNDAEHRMQSAVDGARPRPRHRAHGPRAAGARRDAEGRVLRHADAAEPDGDDQRAGAAPDHDPAVGQDASSAPSRRRSRSPTWASRRRTTATSSASSSRSYRRPAQGAGEGRAQEGRGRARRRPQRAPRLARPPAQGPARQADLGRRRAARAGRGCRRSPTSTSPRSTGTARRRKQELLEV